MTRAPIDRLDFSQFELAPPQIQGPVRLVPVIRSDHRNDLRLGLEGYEATFGMPSIVGLDGASPAKRRREYWAYVPHGLIVSWGNDGTSAAAYGATLSGGKTPPRSQPVTVHHRMAKRTGPNELRLLPLHLSMEGFLSLHMGGPSVAWSTYSRHTRRFGIDHRSEMVWSGDGIFGLDEALRLFEIHEHQVGVLVFVAEALASAFIVAHPEDYRRLHTSLLADFFAEVFTYYAYTPDLVDAVLQLDTDTITDLDSLQAACAEVQDRWADHSAQLAAGLVDRPVIGERLNKMGPFQLQRFQTELDPEAECYIGETIVHRDGSIQYLKTYRLSKSQTKRAHLLQSLADHHWEVEALAAADGDEPDEVIRRINNVGLGYLLNPEVLFQAQRQTARR